MGLLDWVINAIGLLLWLNYWASRFDPFAAPSARPLAGILKPARPQKPSTIGTLVLLLCLIIGRAPAYLLFFASAQWTPTVDLGPLAVVFRSRGDTFWTGVLHLVAYSGLSFLWFFLCFHLWLVVLVAINHREGDQILYLRLLRLYLGRFTRMHPILQLLGAIMVPAVVWLAVRPLLIWLGSLPHADSTGQVFLQSALVSVGAFLTVRYPVGVILLIYFVNLYVYMGQPAWLGFVKTTGQNLLKPIRWLPLRIGALDLAPLAGVMLVFWLCELLRRLLPNIHAF